jgi:hypothetical protein
MYSTSYVQKVPKNLSIIVIGFLEPTALHLSHRLSHFWKNCVKDVHYFTFKSFIVLVIMSSTFRYLLTLKVILNLGNRNMKGKVQ